MKKTVSVLALALLLGATPTARAGDPAGAQASDLAGLRSRVYEWLRVRRETVVRCATCNGLGTIRSYREWGGQIFPLERDCPDCIGGRRIDSQRFRAAYFGAHTAAWRAETANAESVDRDLVALRRDPASGLLTNAEIRDATATGLRCASTRIEEEHGRGKTEFQTYAWILAAERPGAKPVWSLYDPATDGDCDAQDPLGAPGMAEPTPAPPPAPPAPPPAAPPPPSPAVAAVPVSPEERGALDKALAANGARGTVRQAVLYGDVLVVGLFFSGVVSEEDLRSAIDADTVPVVKASMGAVARAASVRLEFLACYRDHLGNLTLRPFATARMRRELFEKIHFENLEREEVLTLFERDESAYPLDDLKLWWKGGCADAALPPSEPPPPSDTEPTPHTAPSPAVVAALRWLAAHQSHDGQWECEGFPRWCYGQPAAGSGPDGKGKAQYDVGVTGLALLAFLRAGYTSRSEGPFGRVVGHGLRYLKDVQDAEGCFGNRSTGHFVYNHAIASLAMVEAYGRTRSGVFKGPAQKALDFIAIARNPYFAWRYGVKPGDNDTSVTGWMMLALTSAKLINAADEKAGKPPSLSLDVDAIEGIKSWIDKMTDPESGRVGYQLRGSGPARPTELVDRFPQEKSEAMTAVAMLARIALGQNPETEDAIVKGAKLCGRLLPTWNENDGAIDMYYWHYATAALRRVGGDVWRTWQQAMRGAAYGNQRREGDACSYLGSWDPLDPWGPDGGRVYSTAMMAMCLEACEQ